MSGIEKLGVHNVSIHMVVDVLNKWLHEGDMNGFSGMWYGYYALCDETGLPVSLLKKIMKLFKSLGIVSYEALFNDEGMLAGKGYISTGKSWDEIKELIDE